MLFGLYLKSKDSDSVSFNPRMGFHEIGVCIPGCDWVVSPPVAIIPANSNGQSQEKINVLAFSLFAITYKYRRNIFEFSDNSSFGVSIAPSFGMTLSVSDNYGIDLFAFQLPVLAEWNLRAGSTYNTTKNVGFVLGIGASYTHFPLLRTDNGISQNPPPAINSFQPEAEIGYKYWHQDNTLREINLSAGFGGKFDRTNNPLLIGTRPFSIRVTWFQYINY
jgi:hypothetical protein